MCQGLGPKTTMKFRKSTVCIQTLPHALERKQQKHTPGLHNKIPAQKIFARVWVAQEPIFYIINAKIFQGLGPKRRESCDC